MRTHVLTLWYCLGHFQLQVRGPKCPKTVLDLSGYGLCFHSSNSTANILRVIFWPDPAWNATLGRTRIKGDKQTHKHTDIGNDRFRDLHYGHTHFKKNLCWIYGKSNLHRTTSEYDIKSGLGYISSLRSFAMVSSSPWQSHPSLKSAGLALSLEVLTYICKHISITLLSSYY